MLPSGNEGVTHPCTATGQSILTRKQFIDERKPYDRHKCNDGALYFLIRISEKHYWTRKPQSAPNPIQSECPATSAAQWPHPKSRPRRWIWKPVQPSPIQGATPTWECTAWRLPTGIVPVTMPKCATLCCRIISMTVDKRDHPQQRVTKLRTCRKIRRPVSRINKTYRNQ